MKNELMKRIVSNMERAIVGKKEAIELTVISLACGGHVLIEDVPGVGKTSLVFSLAKSVSASFKRIQFTPDIMPSDITGFSIYNQKSGEFEFRPGAVMSNIILADEINRTSPKSQASLLEVMEESQVTIDGHTIKLPRPFMVLATQNPVEYLGTYPLPEAQIDRFLVKISLGYPSKENEREILNRYRVTSPLASLEPVASQDEIVELQESVREVHVDSSIYNYIVDIVSKTRNNTSVELGASPRGSLALLKVSQAWAMYSGRDYVIPEDVKRVAIPVLSHRIMLKQDARLRKITAEEVITETIQSVKVPLVSEDEKK